MKFTSTFALSFAALLPAIRASFPGSTFGILYKSTSSELQSAGHLSTFKTEASPHAFTTISETTPDLGGYLTYSGTSGGVLNNACSSVGIAALVPANPPVEGLDYVLQWTVEPLSNLPEGSVSTGFQLGPDPTYDTIINTEIGEGSWTVAENSDGTPVIGWSADVTSGTPIALVKSGVESIVC